MLSTRARFILLILANQQFLFHNRILGEYPGLLIRRGRFESYLWSHIYLGSTIGSAAVSKTEGWSEFESPPGCHHYTLFDFLRFSLIVKYCRFSRECSPPLEIGTI